MSTLVVILSHSLANERVMGGWSWYERSGCDIFGVGRVDTVCKWPEPNTRNFIGSVNVGPESYVDGGPNHLIRFVTVLEILVHGKGFESYDAFALCEYDVIFPRPLPAHTGGLITSPAGFKSPGFHAQRYFHSPWWVDRFTAIAMVTFGKRMLQADFLEGGFLDRWIGLMIDLYDIAVTSAHSYTQNTIDSPEKIQQARDAIVHGQIYCLHGLKTMKQVEAVTQGLSI